MLYILLVTSGYVHAVDGYQISEGSVPVVTGLVILIMIQICLKLEIKHDILYILGYNIMCIDAHLT